MKNIKLKFKRIFHELPSIIGAAIVLSLVGYGLGKKNLMLLTAIMMGIIGTITFLILITDKEEDIAQRNFERTFLFMIGVIFYGLAIVFYAVQINW